MTTNIYVLILIIFTPPLGTNAMQGYSIFPSEQACLQERANVQKRLTNDHNKMLIICANVGDNT